MSKLNCYKIGSCCNDDCFMLDVNENQPCYGEVDVIGEDYYEDEDLEIFHHWWIHACEGHRNDQYKAKSYA